MGVLRQLSISTVYQLSDTMVEQGYQINRQKKEKDARKWACNSCYTLILWLFSILTASGLQHAFSRLLPPACLSVKSVWTGMTVSRAGTQSSRYLWLVRKVNLFWHEFLPQFFTNPGVFHYISGEDYLHRRNIYFIICKTALLCFLILKTVT